MKVGLQSFAPGNLGIKYPSRFEVGYGVTANTAAPQLRVRFSVSETFLVRRLGRHRYPRASPERIAQKSNDTE